MIRKNTKTGIKISEIKLLVLIIFSGTVLIAHSVSSHALQELMSLQANVEQSGTALQSGNVIVTIWDALTGGNLIYNSTTDFYNAISNGKFDIVLGNSTNSLNLEYGKVYYTDFEINGSDVDFKGLERQIFQSSVGNISTEDIRDRSINPADLNDTAAYLFNRIALGGISSQAYNAFSDSKTAAFASTDNDLFIEDILEVGGNTYLAGYAAIGNSTSAANLTVTGNLSVSDISCNSASCISSGEITDATISANDMAVSSVNTTHIADGTITAADLTGDLGLGFGNLTAYPSACSAGQFISALGDNLTCGTPTDTNESTRFNALTGTDCTNNQKAVGFDNNGLIVCTADNDTTYTHLSNFTNNLNLTNAIILHWDNITNKYYNTTAELRLALPYNTTAELRLALPYNTSNEIFKVVNNGSFAYAGGAADSIWINGTSGIEINSSFRRFLNISTGFNISIDEGTLAIDSSNNRVGIGISTGLTDELTISGTTHPGMKIVSTDNSISYLQLSNGTDNFNVEMNRVAGKFGIFGGGATRLTIDADGNLSVDTDTLFVDAIGNRVGIGTTSPSYKLEVNGNVSLNNTLFVTEAGKVGIGTTSPFTGLEVSINNSDTSFGQTASQYALTITNVNGTNNTWAQIVFTDGTDNPATFIGTKFTDTANDNGDLIFATRSGASAAERMTIKSSGNVTIDTNTLFVDAVGNRVGIGTASPDSKLSLVVDGTAVGNAGTEYLRIGNASGTGSTALRLSVNNAGYSFLQSAIEGVSSASLVLQPQGGKVGISDTNPTYSFTVVDNGVLIDGVSKFGIAEISNDAEDQSLLIGYDNLTNFTILKSISSGGYTEPNGFIFETANGAANVNPLVITTQGRIGINTTNPSNTLGVQGAALATGGFATGGPDIAESIEVSDLTIEAGDVVIADINNNVAVAKSTTKYQTNVVGIISTDPGYKMYPKEGMDQNRTLQENERFMALAGRVPTKVTDENGSIRPGDLLTTSSTPGYAMKFTLLDVTAAADFDELKSMLAENERRRNSILGKALEPLESGEDKIIVLVTLQ